MNSVFRKFLFAHAAHTGRCSNPKSPITNKRGAEKSHILCKYETEVEVYL